MSETGCDKCVKKKKKKYIEPKFIHDSKNKPVEVYLDIADYETLLKKLDKLTAEMKAEKKKKKK